MIEQWGWEFARQGLGYLIAGILAFVIVWQQKRIDSKDKQITDLQDKGIIRADSYTTSYTNTIKEVVAASKDNATAVSLLQKSVDTLTTAVQNWINRN